MAECINEIDTGTKEGQLLMAALVILTTSPDIKLVDGHRNGQQMEPDVMLREVNKLRVKMYHTP